MCLHKKRLHFQEHSSFFFFKIKKVPLYLVLDSNFRDKMYKIEKIKKIKKGKKKVFRVVICCN